MGAHNHTINITDTNESQKTFILLQGAPTGNSSCLVLEFCPNIRGEKDGTISIQFTMTDQYYAITGVSRRGSDGKAIVQTSSYRMVSLGPNGSVVAITERNGHPVWDDEAAAGKTANAPGSFEFDTDNTFKPSDSDTIYVGVGVDNPNTRGKVSPIETWTVEPGLKMVIFPKPVYYLTTGQYEPGNVVDRKALGSLVKIDFTAAHSDDAYLFHSSNGAYSDEGGRSAKNGVQVTPEQI